ncbi:hypothetical protein NX059_011984 [Plenodomus lindquistii]|nr:hypothetical protein NX059_011984 [Plenodomus lindquistii]
MSGKTSLTNYVAYQDAQTGQSRVGHYDLANKVIRPLSFISGTPVDNLYQVIEVGEANITSAGYPFSVSVVKVLPPLASRDVLCVGKNYAEHAKEFNSSGFDSSDKVDIPSHPVIFTKRYTSIIADGEEIYPHPEFTSTLDYEGEIGVIIGKPGFRIAEDSAMDYVWGYTIINDVTARERQKDHKQFYIGKSADTFCPMGPIAVPASKLDKVLRVQTHVNGELRQDATTNDLIFSIPYLIKTMSEGQTLMPGDVLATGTPAGVGIGRRPPIYLKPRDTVAVSVSGLGTLTNCIADPSSTNAIVNSTNRVQGVHQQQAKLAIGTTNGATLAQINDKPLHYQHLGQESGPSVVFIHDLGTSSEYFKPLIMAANLTGSHSLHLLDMEGHGSSPTSPLSQLSVSSFAADIAGVYHHASIGSNTTVVAHGQGCLVALQFALTNPSQVAQLILMGPPPLSHMMAHRQALRNLADNARSHGMGSVAKKYDSTLWSKNEPVAHKPLVTAAIRMSLLGQDVESYAKACYAFAGVDYVDLRAIQPETLIIACSGDSSSSPETCEQYARVMRGKVTLKVVEGSSNWHVFENLPEVARLVSQYIRGEMA